MGNHTNATKVNRKNHGTHGVTKKASKVNRKNHGTHGVTKKASKEKAKSKINVKRLKTLLERKDSTLCGGRSSTESYIKQLPTSSKSSNSKDDARNHLESSHFRYLNEQLYTVKSSEAWNLFQEDPQSFLTYHKGFENQIAKWPVNPLDVIIQKLKKEPESMVIADFGCGTARLAKSVSNKVHSFDLVAVNEMVTACDMANVPLQGENIDIAVFCLSLMGTNIKDFLREANRVLKIGGVLHIAEVESRCPDIKYFLKTVEKFGFSTKKHEKKGYFFLATFIKSKNIINKAKLPTIHLKPCVYKKR